MGIESFGGRPDRNAELRIDNEKRVDSMEKTAEKLLTRYPAIRDYMEKVAIHPETLTDYNPSTVKIDMDDAAKMREKMNESDLELQYGKLNGKEVKQLSEILEYQIYTGINKYDWIPFCKAIKTSDFDDIINGVDMVVEYNNEQSFGHLGLGVDVSFSKNLTKKFKRIKDEIDSYDGKDNRLAEVKYFDSKNSGISGRLYGMPRVVAALDLGVMEDLAKMSNMQKNHAAKHAIIIEIQHQLKTFREYAEKNNKACVGQLDRAYKFMTVISQKLESEQKLEMSEYTKNRQIQSAVENGLEIFK